MTPWAHRPLPRAAPRLPIGKARRAARGPLPWTTGTSSSPCQNGPLLLRHLAPYRSAVDNAEDPANNFLPQPGVIESLALPGGPGVRFDGMIYPGYAVPPFYDSLLGKLIVWDETRALALTRLERALGELAIGGIETTVPLYQALLRDPAVREAAVHTKFLEPWLDSRAGALHQQEEVVD